MKIYTMETAAEELDMTYKEFWRRTKMRVLHPWPQGSIELGKRKFYTMKDVENLRELMKQGK
jgi:hypothetical protein